MAAPAPSSLTDLLLGLATATPDPANRLVVDGLGWSTGDGGTLTLTIRRLETTALRLALGPVVADIGRAELHELAATLRLDGGKPGLAALTAARAEFSGVTLQGPLQLPQRARSAASGPTWKLDPLATAQGTLRAEILDAHLLFDAQVTVPIRHGGVDFKDATVEHVGPDTRMGASRLGLYVDAPNGRSYLYQFPTSPVPGVTYETRGAMLGPWVTERGSVQLQAFAQWILCQGWDAQSMGIPDQARRLFDRTSLAGDVQLGDGTVEAPGVHATLAGSAEARNTVRLQSQAVGRGLTASVPALSVRDAGLQVAGTELQADAIDGAADLQLLVEGGQLRCVITLGTLQLSGLRLQV